MLLIGSHAFRFYNPNFPTDQRNRFKDYDLISSYEEYDSWVKVQPDILECYPIDKGKKMIVKCGTPHNHRIYEFEIAWEGSTAKSLIDNPKVFSFDMPSKIIDNFTHTYVPSLNVLYTIKMSHRYLKNSPHFLKTMEDIKLMKSMGASIPEYLKDWFKEREKETYWYSLPKLNQSKMDFFDPDLGVKYIFNHDDIHKSVARMENPAYTYYQKDGEEVACDKNKFFDASEEVRLNGVYEEAAVLSLERSLIPFKGKISPEWAFNKALEKVATSITGGWFREWSYNNYDKVKSMFNPAYVNKFWKDVEVGKVRPFGSA